MNKPLLEISVDLSHQNNLFGLFECFLNSADMLFATTLDGIEKNKINQLGLPTDEFWYQQLIPAFYLLRHSLELALKALIKEVTGEDAKGGHDLKAVWQCLPEDWRQGLYAVISPAFETLKKYQLFKDEQLFRYPQHSKGKKLEELPPMYNQDFDSVSAAIWNIRQAILEAIHVKKGLPL